MQGNQQITSLRNQPQYNQHQLTSSSIGKINSSSQMKNQQESSSVSNLKSMFESKIVFFCPNKLRNDLDNFDPTNGTQGSMQSIQKNAGPRQSVNIQSDNIKKLASVFEKKNLAAEDNDGNIDQQLQDFIKSKLNQKRKQTTAATSSNMHKMKLDMSKLENKSVQPQQQQTQSQAFPQKQSFGVPSNSNDYSKSPYEEDQESQFDQVFNKFNGNNSGRGSLGNSTTQAPIRHGSTNQAPRSSVYMTTERGNQFIEEYVPLNENIFKKKDETIKQRQSSGSPAKKIPENYQKKDNVSQYRQAVLSQTQSQYNSLTTSQNQPQIQIYDSPESRQNYNNEYDQIQIRDSKSKNEVIKEKSAENKFLLKENQDSNIHKSPAQNTQQQHLIDLSTSNEKVLIKDLLSKPQLQMTQSKSKDSLNPLVDSIILPNPTTKHKKKLSTQYKSNIFNTRHSKNSSMHLHRNQNTQSTHNNEGDNSFQDYQDEYSGKNSNLNQTKQHTQEDMISPFNIRQETIELEKKELAGFELNLDMSKLTQNTLKNIQFTDKIYPDNIMVDDHPYGVIDDEPIIQDKLPIPQEKISKSSLNNSMASSTRSSYLRRKVSKEQVSMDSMRKSDVIENYQSKEKLPQNPIVYQFVMKKHASVFRLNKFDSKYDRQ
ncbi:UNKNOWN [Stylonychia lemnae]|uniref:Uncharacterized protein n=1 Tax=Stylonychia lemnae TaxID=5949 RepID=A0A078B015_STYLE|nr:UNKNOWN [Stylonychia lemnae]|eukprot:CDW87844.1 UNKNOWN [Stylonychia lemnae]